MRAVNEGLADAKGQSAAHLRPKLLELFGHVTATVTNDADIWRSYAQLLTEGPEEASQTDRERVSTPYGFHSA